MIALILANPRSAEEDTRPKPKVPDNVIVLDEDSDEVAHFSAEPLANVKRDEPSVSPQVVDLEELESPQKIADKVSQDQKAPDNGHMEPINVFLEYETSDSKPSANGARSEEKVRQLCFCTRTCTYQKCDRLFSLLESDRSDR